MKNIIKKEIILLMVLIFFVGACSYKKEGKVKDTDIEFVAESIKKTKISNIDAVYKNHQPSDVLLPIETEEEYMNRMKWWKDAKYGMFIHWGFYSYLGGEFNGKAIGEAAVIQKDLKIPLAEYKQVVKKFNPQQFDADGWVSLVKAAGMKYIVLTAKHHDGFAMFNSKVSDYDIMSTPYNKDIVKLLKNACAKQGIKFGLYYSHLMDWEHPHAYVGEGKLRNRMNLLDFNPEEMDRSIYLKEKAFPQLKEMLTNYGKIDILWFDMGTGLTNNEIRQFVKITREIQPEIIISSRVGAETNSSKLNKKMLFDFYTPGDNYFTGDDLSMPWEMVGTTNGSWGYNKNDHEWRSPNFILSSLVSSVSRNGNYLLNVGPNGLGNIPSEPTKNLKIAGDWLKTNGKAIYGTTGSPFPWNFEWGYVTQKPNKIYLLIFNWPVNNQVIINGLLSDVNSINVLGKTKSIRYQQQGRFISIDLKDVEKDKFATVLEVHYNDALKISKNISQSLDKTICLDRIASKYDKEEFLSSWKFKVTVPGVYKIQLISNEVGRHSNPVWRGSEQKGSIDIAGKTIPVTLTRDTDKMNPTLFFYKEITSKIGEVEFAKVGTYTLHLKGFQIGAGKWDEGLALNKIELTPNDL